MLAEIRKQNKLLLLQCPMADKFIAASSTFIERAAQQIVQRMGPPGELHSGRPTANLEALQLLAHFIRRMSDVISADRNVAEPYSGHTCK